MSKGLTLIEMIAVLIILSALTLILVPNINDRIKNARLVAYDVQVEAIKDAGISYFTDNLNYTDLDEYVLLADLQEGGYIGDIKNKLIDAEFSKYTLVIKSRELVEADINNNSEVKISFHIMDTSHKYMQFLAEDWYEINKDSIDLSIANSTKTLVRTLTFIELESLAYVGTTEYPLITNNKLIEIQNGTYPTEDFTIGIYAELIDTEYVITYE